MFGVSRLIVLGLLSLVACSPAQPVVAAAPGTGNAINTIKAYLAANYNPDIGLYREAPNVAPNTYWVYSDGYLAGAAVSKWNVPVFVRWTVINGAVVPEEVFAYQTKVIDLGNGVRSETEDPTASRMNDWLEYGDRLLLAALNARSAKNKARERELTQLADQMWDGRGLRDKVYRVDGKYETYKTALYFRLTGNVDARTVLLSLQEQDKQSNRYGGIYTEYGEDGRPFAGTDTNIETSALTMRAFQRR